MLYNCCSSHLVLQMQEAETASDETAIVHYHEEEAVYISAQTDRVTVIFSTLFKDPDDIVIGKVWLTGLNNTSHR